jgi:hypothetical protein
MVGFEAQINNQMTIKTAILDLNSDIVLPDKSDLIGPQDTKVQGQNPE